MSCDEWKPSLASFYDCPLLRSQNGYKIFCDRSDSTGPLSIYGFLVRIEANKAIYSLEYNGTPPCRTDQIALTKFSLYEIVLHSNGTARDKVTVIGRDQIGLLGQTDGTNKKPM